MSGILQMSKRKKNQNCKIEIFEIFQRYGVAPSFPNSLSGAVIKEQNDHTLISQIYKLEQPMSCMHPLFSYRQSTGLEYQGSFNYSLKVGKDSQLQSNHNEIQAGGNRIR